MDKDIRFTEKKIDESWKDSIEIDKKVKDAAEAEKKPATDEQKQQRHPPSPDGINFSSLISSFAMQAMIHLGDIPHPTLKKTEENLEAAKEMIDILGVIEEKTQGNLSADEAKLLKTVLYDVRMRYIQKKSK
jgi:hypothetical protein